MADNSPSPKSFHEKANAAYLAGDYQTAISIQKKVVAQHQKDGKQAVVARKLLALYFYSAKNLDAAIKLLMTLAEEQPDDAEILENIGVMLRQCGQYQEAVRYLQKAGEMAPEKFNIFDGLAHCFHTLKKPEEVQIHGRKSLELKDLAYKDGLSWPIPDGSPPELDEKNPQKNVISFSLFGNNPRYLHGALRNIRLAADLYPHWVCRFYCDPLVPADVITEMKQLGCQVVMKGKPKKFYDGLLWRFEVIDDPTIDRFLIRDCDSVVNIKERVAVDEWLASDKWFHLMRDFSSHTELILAGMWGGISGVLPTLAELDEAYQPSTAATRTYDQHLLREMVWPTIKKSVLIHDSVYTGCLGSVPYPEVGRLPRNRHIGQNEAAVIPADQMVFLNNELESHASQQKFFVFGQSLGGKQYLQQLLNSHSNVHCPQQHQLNAISEINKRSISRYEQLIKEKDRRANLQSGVFDSNALERDLFNTWLEQFFTCDDSEVTHCGVMDCDVDKFFDRYVKMFGELKFVFVVRDPRDVAVGTYQFRKTHDPGFDRDGSQMNSIAKSTAKLWTEKIRNVQSYNQSNPGRVELVRFEDLLNPKKKYRALARVLNFLGLDGSVETVEKMFIAVQSPKTGAVGLWQDALSLNQIGLVEAEAGGLMKLLKYSLSPHDHRAVETDGTILPS